MKVFKEYEEPFDIPVFGFWHIFYIVIILGFIGFCAFFFQKKSEAARDRLLKILALVTGGLYAFDFFAMPLYLDGNFGAYLDKLPFHICTLMSIFMLFAQFNPKFERIKEPIVFLCVVAPLMYITYPGSAIGDESPFCYRVVQTFLYHGALLSWGVLNLAYRKVEPNIRHCWKAFVGILMITAWAKLGNAVYSTEGNSYDWFFVNGNTFGSIVPNPWLTVLVILAVSAMVMIIYGLYYLALKIIANNSAKRETKEIKEPALKA